jgi:hypothetical protein
MTGNPIKRNMSSTRGSLISYSYLIMKSLLKNAALAEPFDI